ncbi:MAG: hypothetical protein ACLGIR_01480 [Actinomycetes bacterium]
MSEDVTRGRSGVVLLALLVGAVVVAVVLVGVADAGRSGERDAAGSDVDGVVLATDRYNTFEHIFLTSSVLRVTAAGFRPAPDDGSWPTVDLLVHEVVTDLDAARRDPVLGLADAATMRSVSDEPLVLGREYLVFANVSEGTVPPWRVAFAFDAETMEPAPGYGTPEALETLERLREIAADEPSMDLLEVVVALIVEQRAVQGLPSQGRGVVDRTPISDLLYGDVSPVGARDALDELLARSPLERSLPGMRDEVVPGFAEALGVELVPVEVAVVGGEHLAGDIVSLGLHFDEVGVLGWSAVQDDVFALIGLGPAGVPYEVLPRYADGTIGPPITIGGAGPDQRATADLLAPSGGELTVVATVRDDGSVELARMGRLQFDEYLESVATAGQPSPEG